MKAQLDRKPDNEITLTITLPKEEIEKAKAIVINQAVENTVLPGFRKGKAPKKLVEQNVSQEKLREEVLKHLLPKAYVEAITEHKLNPIMHPKINMVSMEEGKDWQFTATTCEAPIIDLGDYKKKIKDVTAKSKIVIPGKEPQEPNFDEIMATLVESTKVTIPHILLDAEVDRLLSQTLDEVKRLGLTLDQYLNSTGKKPEQLREEYTVKARRDIAIELALQKIAETENIVIEEKDINEAIAKAKDDNEKKQLQQNRYLFANILKQQKTLDFLKNL